VIGASVYIIVCSARNRIRVRLRRLKEPRYFIGGAAAIVYFYFTVFARMWGRSRASRGRPRSIPIPADMLALLQTAGPTLVGIALLVIMALAWLFPGDSGLLAFTPSETDFLFPAPVSRRALLVHRLLRSQLGLLFAAIVPAFLFPSGSAASRVKFAVSMWLIFLTMRVHFTGITLARASLALGQGKRRQWGALAVMLAAVAVVGGAVIRACAGLRSAADIPDAVERLGAIGVSGIASWILWPFTALARPLFAESAGAYGVAITGALVVFAVNLVWVLRSDEAFQDAVSDAEARRAEKKLRDRPVVRARSVGWQLALSGRPESMFAWKNAMQMLRGTTSAAALRYIAPAVGVGVGASSAVMAATRASGAAAAIGSMALAAAAFAIVLGPQVARSDLREDLLHLELLKTWPVPPAAVVRGEMLAPAMALTLVAWSAIACALVLSAAAFSAASLASRASIGATIAIVAPALISAQLTVHNAAAILFPAWVPLGTARPRGLDAMGQRLILFFGVVLAMVLMLLPGAIPAALVWLALHGLLGTAAFVPAATVLAAIVLVEVFVATEALGPLYERLDLTAIEKSE